MGELIRLCPTQQAMVDSAKEFLEEVEAGRLHCGVMIYRTNDGTIARRVLNPDGHDTYLIGLVEEMKFNMQLDRWLPNYDE